MTETENLDQSARVGALKNKCVALGQINDLIEALEADDLGFTIKLTKHGGYSQATKTVEMSKEIDFDVTLPGDEGLQYVREEFLRLFGRLQVETLKQIGFTQSVIHRALADQEKLKAKSEGSGACST